MAQLVFFEEDHRYQLDGKDVPSVTQICDIITASKYSVAENLVREAARRGAAVHEYCQLIDYGAEPDTVEPELVGYVMAYKRFLRDYRPEWTHIEHRIANELLGYAGTMDRRGKIGRLTVTCDLKTTASMDRTSKISLCAQLVGYDKAAVASGLPPADMCTGVQLHKDGTYTIHDRARIEKKYGFDSGALFLDLLSITKLIGGYA